MNNGLLVSFEGISGVGKSYVFDHFRQSAPEHYYLPELSQRKNGQLIDADIVKILSKSSSKFFTGGLPATETALLIALKVFDFEHYLRPELAQGKVVIEDRSIDTIAVYQSIIMNNGIINKTLDDALLIFDQAKQLRPAPDLTFLIDDEFGSSITRATGREGSAYSQEQIELLSNANSLYPLYADKFPQRIVKIDRRQLDVPSIVTTITAKINECLRSKR